MKVLNQDNFIASKRINNQFVTNSKTGEKELAINILLNGFEKNTKLFKPHGRRFDTFEQAYPVLIKSETDDVKRTSMPDDEVSFDENGYAKFGFYSWHQYEKRQELNMQINRLFEENGILLSKDERLTFEIDFYNYIHVMGQDSEKAGVIERILNENISGLILAVYTKSAILDRHNDFLDENYSLFKNAGTYSKKYLGFELYDLILKNGKVFTPDGVSLEEALKNSEAIKQMKETDFKNANYAVEAAVECITMSLIIGFNKDKASNIFIKIDFKDGSLMDIYTPQYGYGKGQTEWIEKFKTHGIVTEELLVHVYNILDYINRKD